MFNFFFFEKFLINYYYEKLNFLKLNQIKLLKNLIFHIPIVSSILDDDLYYKKINSFFYFFLNKKPKITKLKIINTIKLKNIILVFQFNFMQINLIIFFSYLILFINILILNIKLNQIDIFLTKYNNINLIFKNLEIMPNKIQSTFLIWNNLLLFHLHFFFNYKYILKSFKQIYLKK
jgi:hypothetical protein